jgi:hypothetical protein
MPCQAFSLRCWSRCCGGSNRLSNVLTRRATLWWIAALCTVLALAFASGCARTVLVSEGSPIRTGPNIKGRVYHRTAEGWELSDNCVQVPEGWYCVPPSFVEQAHEPDAR